MSTASSSYAAIGYLATQPSIYEIQRDSHQPSVRQQRRVTIIDFPTPSLNGEPSSPIRTSSRSNVQPRDHQLVHPAANDPELLSPYYQYARGQPASATFDPQTSPQATGGAAWGSQLTEHPPIRVPSPSSPTHPVHVRPYALPPPRSPVSPLLAAPPATAFPPHKRSREALNTPLILGYSARVRLQSPAAAAPSGPRVTGSPAVAQDRRPPIPVGYAELLQESDADRQTRERLLRARQKLRTRSVSGVPRWSRFSIMATREPRPLEDR